MGHILGALRETCLDTVMPNREPTKAPPYKTEREYLKRVCSVEFVRTSGPGGQHKNRRETGVRLFHPPSGVEIIASERRERPRNLELAYERLIEILSQRNRVRRQRIPTRIPKSQKRRRLESKRRQSTRKANRRVVDDS